MSLSTYSPILSVIYNFSKSRKSFSVLDYGCGDGSILDYISDINLGSYDGIEVNKNAVNFANKKYQHDKRMNFYHITNTSLPINILKKKYDLIIFLGVTPYMSVEEIKCFFQMALQVMTKDGIIVGYSRTNHFLYTITDLYQLVLPHTGISSKELIQIASNFGFRAFFQREMGLLIAPLFNNTIVLGFDGLDKLIFRTRGTLGPFGKSARAILAPIIELEQSIPLNYGYKFYFAFERNLINK